MSSNVKTITVQELAVWLNDRPTSSFIDVREPSELKEQGVIKGYDANIPYFLTKTDLALFEKLFSALDKEQQLIISCRSGRRSQLAAEYVVEHLGFQNVYNVEGGILKWMEQGYPTEVAAF